MRPFLDLLASNPLILLFAVAAVGVPIGKLRAGGATLGFSAVLFAGMAFGMLDPRLRIPDHITNLGLAIFLYCLGIASAPGFFAAFKGGSALRQNLLAASALLIGAVVCVLLGRVAGLSALQTAGLFSGAGTNASSLAAAFDQARAIHLPGQLGDAAVAYALSFPAGILMPMVVFFAMQKWFKVDLQKEAAALPGYRAPGEALEVWTFRVINEAAAGLTKREILAKTQVLAAMGRILRKAVYLVPTAKTRLELNDLVVFIGAQADLQCLEAFLGERSPHEIHRRGLEAFEDFGLFVSNAALIGRPLRELKLPSRHEAIISRVRRGDQNLVPHGEMRLELGDRVWVIAHRESRKVLSAIFGDSYRASSEGDFLTFSLGLAAGLLLGLVPIRLPGNFTFHLGISGGALLMGLLLGRFTRIGSWVFSMPFATSVVLRQLGLVVFFAGAGTAAGASLPRIPLSTLLLFLALGTLLTAISSFVVLWWGYRRMKLSLNTLGGLLAGTQTQSSLLDFATKQSGNELPAHSYAVVYPLATVLKIVLAQVLLVRFL